MRLKESGLASNQTRLTDIGMSRAAEVVFLTIAPLDSSESYEEDHVLSSVRSPDIATRHGRDGGYLVSYFLFRSSEDATGRTKSYTSHTGRKPFLGECCGWGPNTLAYQVRKYGQMGV